MSDDVIELTSGSTPPGSPLSDKVISKVTDMCYEYKKSNSSRTDAPIEPRLIHHELSDSEDEVEMQQTQEHMDVKYFGPDLDVFTSAYDFDAGEPECLEAEDVSPRQSQVKGKKVTKRNTCKEEMKRIKQQDKEVKLKERQEKQALQEKIKLMKPGECLKTGTPEVQEPHILYLWPYETLISSIKYCRLLDDFKQYYTKNQGCKIHLGVLSTKNPKQQKGAKGTERASLNVPRNQIEMSLAELQITYGVSHRFLEKPDDLALFLYQLTKAIAETPFKVEQQKKDQERSWFTRGDSRDCVRIDKDYNGLTRLWHQQLSQFHNSSLDVARAISGIYPTPFSLYQAYKNIPTDKERASLLQDIPIVRCNVASSSTRRVGPELSKKIALLFSQENGDIMLSQE